MQHFKSFFLKFECNLLVKRSFFFFLNATFVKAILNLISRLSCIICQDATKILEISTFPVTSHYSLIMETLELKSDLTRLGRPRAFHQIQLCSDHQLLQFRQQSGILLSSDLPYFDLIYHVVQEHSLKQKASFTFLDGRKFVTHFCLQHVTQKQLKYKKRLH